MKRLSLLITLLALVLAASSPASALPRPKEEWIELRTANFTLFSNAGEKRTREVGADLERLRDALSQLSPGLVLNSPYPTYIFVFRNSASFKPYQRLYNGKSVELGGYFLSQEMANYVAVNGDQRGDETLILYHEYLHYVLRNNYAGLPLWLNEGLAEYYSTFQVMEDEARIGLPIQHHVAWLRGNPLLPLSQLLAMDQDSKEYNETSRRGTFYAQSWALVHYLISGSPERRRQAVEYLRLAQAGERLDVLFQRAFGADPAVLERELRQYVQSYLFQYTRAPLRSEANFAMQGKPLPRADLLTRLGDLLANLGPEHFPKAREHYQAALEAQADHGPAHAGLGYLHELAGRKDEALSFYEKAARLAPDDFAVQYLYARRLIDGEGVEALLRARAALQKVVALRPDFGEAWARLGYTYDIDEEVTPEALTALETAHSLLPSRPDVAYNLAMAYAATGEAKKAEVLIDTVLAPQGRADLVTKVREVFLSVEHARAEDLLGEQRAEEALEILERLRKQTAREERREALTARIAEVQGILAHNRFVERYNEAVSLANRGDVAGAAAILEPLAQTTENPDQARKARELLIRLKPPKTKRK